MLAETIGRQRKMLEDLEQRIGESELALDDAETEIHQRRREANGDNYLQDAYLEGGGGDGGLGDGGVGDGGVSLATANDEDEGKLQASVLCMRV